MRYNACIALSFIVGIPNGRSFPLLFLICTLLNGCGEYPRLFNSVIAFALAIGVFQVLPSTPAVAFPLLEDTLFTANVLA